MQRFYLVFFLTLITIASCTNNTVPKPPAYLRLEYPKANYVRPHWRLPFSFEKNTQASVTIIPLKGSAKNYGITLKYPQMKGSIFLTYKTIEPAKKRLASLLKDAQKMTREHMKKADEIIASEYTNPQQRVYGTVYKITGNAASQAQFYATDSTDHFLTGSLYFYTKPNYDSILPAADYIEKDIIHLVETLRWE